MLKKLTLASVTVLESSESWDEQLKVEVSSDKSAPQVVEKDGLDDGSVMLLNVTVTYENSVHIKVTEYDAVGPNDLIHEWQIDASQPLGPYVKNFQGDGGSYAITGVIVPDVSEVPGEVADAVQHVLVDGPLSVTGLADGFTGLNGRMSDLASAQAATTATLGSINGNLGNITGTLGMLSGGLGTVGNTLGALKNGQDVANAALGGIQGSLGGLVAGQEAIGTTLAGIEGSLGSLGSQVQTGLADLRGGQDAVNTTLTGIDGSLGTGFGEVKGAVDGVNDTLGGLVGGLAVLAEGTAAGFGALQTGMGTLHTDLGAVNTTLGTVTTAVDGIGLGITSVDGRLESMGTAFKAVADGVGSIHEDLGASNATLQELRTQLETLNGGLTALAQGLAQQSAATVQALANINTALGKIHLGLPGMPGSNKDTTAKA